jgi:hypothetical protein
MKNRRNAIRDAMVSLQNVGMQIAQGNNILRLKGIEVKAGQGYVVAVGQLLVEIVV